MDIPNPNLINYENRVYFVFVLLEGFYFILFYFIGYISLVLSQYPFKWTFDPFLYQSGHHRWQNDLEKIKTNNF